MFRTSALVALVAAASFGVAAISAGTAGAKPYVPNGKIAQPRFMPKPHVPNGPPKIVHFKPHKPHVHPHWPHKHKHPHWHVHVKYPAVYSRPVVYGAPVAAAPLVTTSRCSCLVKEYTPEGAVLFRDVCTNETAMNPPAAAVAPTALVAPEAQQ